MKKIIRLISVTLVWFVLMCVLYQTKFGYSYELLPIFHKIDKSGNGTVLEKVSQSDKSSSKKGEPMNLYARSAALIDASCGRVLYSQNGKKHMSMASTTKIMTCIVVLENMKKDQIATVSEYAASQPDVQLNVVKGEKFYVKDLLYALMLESCNDVAVVLAENIGGSVDGFAEMMNKKAKSISCNDTHFVTPNGLDAKEHYSTAEDMCKIGMYAIENKAFREIIATPTYTLTEQTHGKQYMVNNKDAFLSQYPGAIGIKTGFTGNAGYCFVGAVKTKDRTLVSAVLACGWPPNKRYKWSDTKKLMDYGCEKYVVEQFFRKKVVPKDLDVIEGKNNRIELYSKPFHIKMLSDHSENEYVMYEHPQRLFAPIKRGKIVGNLYYIVDDTLIKKQKVYTIENIEKRTFYDYVSVMIKIWAL